MGADFSYEADLWRQIAYFLGLKFKPSITSAFQKLLYMSGHLSP